MTRRDLALAAGLLGCMAAAGWVAPVGQGGPSLPPRGLTVEPVPVHGNTGRAPANPPGLRDDLARARARETHWRNEAARWRRVARHTPTVAEALTLAAVVYQVPRRDLERVAYCESRYTPTARNGPYRGLFQMGGMFEAGPFGRAGLSVWSPYAAALMAGFTVGREGWRQWACQPDGSVR